MSDSISHTAYDDAPLSAAKNPNAMAVDGQLAVHPNDVLVGRSVTIDRPREALYAFWRNFSNLPCSCTTCKA
jgi:uncharacterized membrane protein